MPMETAHAASHETDLRAPDIATMREAANRLLDPDAVPGVLPLVGEELATLTLRIKGHVQLLEPEVEQAARKLPEDSVPRYLTRSASGTPSAPAMSSRGSMSLA